jgi:hypothetical protein
MSRHTLGVVALLLLIVGGIAAVQHPESGAAFSGACVRVGMVLGAAWLAWPQIASLWKKTPRWLLIATGVGVAVCIVQPLWALAAIPVLAALWFLGPKLTAMWKSKSGLQSSTATRPAGETGPPEQPAGPKRPRRRPNAR